MYIYIYIYIHKQFYIQFSGHVEGLEIPSYRAINV